jgi:hypothetical protein
VFSLKASSWITFAGIAIAAIVLVAGKLDAQRLLKAKADEARNCDAVSLYHIVPTPTEEWKAQQPALCRAHVAEERAAIEVAGSWGRWPAAIIAILGLVPWGWYFLSRRVTEMRARY